MRYRAFWKSTWYESEDYGALCRCLFWVGATSFIGPDADVNSYFRGNLIYSDSVLVQSVEDEE